MRNEALPVIVGAAVISGLLCLVIGGVLGVALLAPASAPTSAGNASIGPVAKANAESARTAPDDPIAPQPDAKTSQDLRAARERADKLDSERQAAVLDRDTLASENARLKERVATLEKELGDAKAAPTPDRPASTGKLPVAFGAWGELDELKNADWNDLGGALQGMTPHMDALAQSLREGKQPDPEIMKKIGAQNMKLVKLAVALQGKVPTHTSNVNGEYTHPITMVNLLAAQLAAAGNPLSDAQRKRLSEHGDEYEKRWKTQNEGYGAETLLLKKILDEAELKQWFTDQMWQVTTPEQKALVVTPSVEGYLGLDLYSPALMFQGIARPLQAPARDVLKGHMKDWMARNFGVTRETLDGAEYAFDDWLTSMTLEPKAVDQAAFMHFREILAAGKAQLSLLTTLLGTVLNDAEVTKKVQAEDAVIVPQVLQQ